MSEIGTLIFDLGNVVIGHDDEFLTRRIVERSPASTEKVNKAWRQLRNRFQRGEMAPREFFEKFSRVLGGFEGNYEGFKQVLSSHFSRKREMEAFVRKVSDSGYKIALLSNTNAIHYEFIEDNFPVVELFDPVILSFRVGARKPEKEIFKAALERISAEPEECVFIDDREENARAAERAGIRGIHFRGKESLLRELEELGIEF
ncbi:MAG: HAD family phosphatase [Candidatus Nanohaloarchaea archaeon]|nr:HAD family phosphatase [Candidatus Nanohaloarchaea archaeon]